MRLNLYRAEHAGYTLKVWHDLTMCWFMQIDVDPARGLTEGTRAAARMAAHDYLHQQAGETGCSEQLRWKLDARTRTVVLGECDECFSPNMLTQEPETPGGNYVRTCTECGYRVSFPPELLQKMAR